MILETILILLAACAIAAAIHFRAEADEERQAANDLLRSRNYWRASAEGLVRQLTEPGHANETEERVIAAIRRRRLHGREKYGTTMDRTDLTPAQWLQHAQEEAMDLAIYLERLKSAHITPAL